MRKGRTAYGGENPIIRSRKHSGRDCLPWSQCHAGLLQERRATVQVLDKDGWLHTGDLALMDAEGNVSIKGRSKNMLLGPSGQNIYPEEIEDKLNNMPYVPKASSCSRMRNW